MNWPVPGIVNIGGHRIYDLPVQLLILVDPQPLINQKLLRERDTMYASKRVRKVWSTVCVKKDRYILNKYSIKYHKQLIRTLRTLFEEYIVA